MKERKYMNMDELEIQRYDLGLMTPEERSAFESAVDRSSVLQQEFTHAGDALSAMYVRLADGMPDPPEEAKKMVLDLIREPAGLDHPEVFEGPVVALTPGVISEPEPYAAGIGTTRSPRRTITLLLLAITLGALSVAGVGSLVGNHEMAASFEKPIIQNTSSIITSQNISPFSDTRITTLNTAIARDTKISGVSKQIISPMQEKIEDIPSIPIDVPKEENRVPAIPPIETQLPAPSKNNESLHEIQPARNPKEDQPFAEHISLVLHHMSKIKYYPGRDEYMAPVPNFNNLGGGIRYSLSHDIAIGAEVGFESFPFYLGKKDGSYEDMYSIFWGGASLTMTYHDIEFLGCSPQARVVLGFYNAGPMFKTSLGFSSPEFYHVSLIPEIEYTGVFAKDDGKISEGGKLGFTVSAAYHF